MTVFTVTRNSSGVITTNTTNITNTTKPSTDGPQNTNDIPLYAMITIGILVLILLSPIISASIGTTSVELTIVDRSPEK